MLQVTHLAFGDESHWNIGRYRGLGLVTMKNDDYTELRAQLIDILRGSDVREFKWKNLGSARDRFAALKMCEFTVQSAYNNSMRVDVLTWDIEDSRHKIRGRDDLANLQRMYYHLFKNVLKERWPDGCVWKLHPDEHTEMDWENVHTCLSWKEIEFELKRNLFTKGKFKILIRHIFKINEIVSVASHEEPFIQLADLFAGLGVFSREHYHQFFKWRNKYSLFEELGPSSVVSRSEEERFKILFEFNRLCKKNKLQISLDTNKGLRSYAPQKPINFWWYEPQHIEDKAPTKER